MEHAEIDQRLKGIMREIHQQCTERGTDSDGRVIYVRGANLASFKRLADAMGL
jgi:glutamate dehydrogenase (NADP+)